MNCISCHSNGRRRSASPYAKGCSGRERTSTNSSVRLVISTNSDPSYLGSLLQSDLLSGQSGAQGYVQLRATPRRVGRIQRPPSPPGHLSGPTAAAIGTECPFTSKTTSRLLSAKYTHFILHVTLDSDSEMELTIAPLNSALCLLDAIELGLNCALLSPAE